MSEVINNFPQRNPRDAQALAEFLAHLCDDVIAFKVSWTFTTQGYVAEVAWTPREATDVRS